MTAEKIILAVILCAAAAAAVFFAIRAAVGRYTDRKLEKYQSDLMDKHYAEVENMYRQMRGWRHDYKNHIAAMKIHLENGNYELLKDYLDGLGDDLMTVDAVLKTGNVMVDAILNSKLSLAASKNIKTDAVAHVPKKLNISDIDICVIIGNLLDNAIEAASKFDDPEKRFIRVYIGIFKGQLYISVSNSVGGEIKKEGRTYYSTKGGAHGFGLQRIDKITAKYSGFINRQDETDVFATEITLPVIV